MKNLTRALGALGVTLCLFSYAGQAHALGPIDVEAALKGGYATNDVSSGPGNGLGGAFGARAGVGIFGIYGGVSVLRYFGSSPYSSWAVGGELGYSLSVSILTIRPQIGLGNLQTDISGCPVGLSCSNGTLYVEPGVTALISFGLPFVGVDANAMFLPSANNANAAFTLHAQLGVKF
jgi:hypothetical protein